MIAASCVETAASNVWWARTRCPARAAHGVDVLPRGDAETEPGGESMSEVRKTRKGEWWQVHGRSAAEVTCAAVMPSAECVRRHGPEELQYQMLRPANIVGECLAMDTRMIGVEVHEPQLRRVCASAALAPSSTAGGKNQCTASRHFMATLGAPRPRRFEQNGNCSPTRAASSTRCCRRAAAVSTNSLLEDRARVQHMMRGCAPAFCCAHDQRVQEKQNKLVQTLRLNHGTTDIHSTEEDTKMEHIEQNVPDSIARTQNPPTLACG